MRNFLMTVSCIVATLISGVLSSADAAVIDDFSDGNDTANPTWTHLNGLVASTGQVWDASTGQYHMTAPNNGFSQLGFVGSYVAESLSDVLVSADIVSFVDDPVAQGGPFAVAARLDGNNAFNTLKGYAYAYEPGSAGGNGEFALYRVVGASLVDLNAIGVENVDYFRKVTLDPTKDYTFTLSIVGSLLTGQVREVGGPIVAYQTAIDATYASGSSGLFAYSQNPAPTTDVTWDNFQSLGVPEPATTLLLPLGIMGFTLLGRNYRSPCNS